MHRLMILLLAALVFVPHPRPAAAQSVNYVDLELILAVDVSGSMDGEEQRFQRAGYLAALVHPDVIRAIRSGPNRRIALTYVEWAGDERQAVTVPWRIVSDAASAKAFADKLAATPVAFLRGTSISSILEYGAKYFAESGVTGLRRVIDVSGDGPNNEGWFVLDARERVLKQGIIINGLPIMLEPSMGRRPPFGLDVYYRDCVIGGPGAFVLPVTSKRDWASAIRRKLILEIAGGPARIWKAQMRQPKAPTGTDCKIGEKLRRFWDP